MSPIYQLSPLNKNVQQAYPGLPTYLLGSLNRLVADTRMKVTAVSAAGTTLTYFVTVIEGQLPVAGQLLTVAGCTANAQFNVTNASIASVSFTDTPEDGIGSITVTQSPSVVATNKTTDYGAGIAPQSEVGELISSLSVSGGAFSSQEVAFQSNTGPQNPLTIRAEVVFPVLPGAALVQIYTADRNVDADYYLLGTVAAVSGGVLNGTAGATSAAQIFTGIRANFARAYISGLAAVTGAKIVFKVTI